MNFTVSLDQPNRPIVWQTDRLIEVYCETPIDVCRDWNKKKGSEGYNEELFEDLSKRMEEPNSRSKIALTRQMGCPIIPDHLRTGDSCERHRIGCRL